jgi:hypothetical protein
MSDRKIPRREFLLTTATTTVAAALGLSCQAAPKPRLYTTSTGLAPNTLPPDWLWASPQPPQHSLVFRHNDAINRTTAVPSVHLLPSGQIEVDFAHDIPLSDAIQIDPQRPMYVSDDGGQTWQLSPTTPRGLVQGCSEGIGWPTTPIQLPNGALITCGAYGWENLPEQRQAELEAQGFYTWISHPGTVSYSHRAWKNVSRDGGKTWKCSQIHPNRQFACMNFYNADGQQLLDGSYVKAGYGAFKSPTGPQDCCFFIQTTDAENFSAHAIAFDDGRGYCEPALAQATNGDLLCLMRTRNQRDLFLNRSTDNGKTWSTPYDSGLRGSTPWMTRSTDGYLVAVFGRRGYEYFPQTGLWAGVSKDHGHTWTQFPLVIRGAESFQANGTVIPLPDGSCIATYAFMNGEGIGATRFHPDYHA